jgi:hypothetical protein
LLPVVSAQFLVEKPILCFDTLLKVLNGRAKKGRGVEPLQIAALERRGSPPIDNRGFTRLVLQLIRDRPKQEREIRFQ